jgi:predicted 3-demethylubiquinone-9 3-methyltransferase (glyoxalase superfamily)
METQIKAEPSQIKMGSKIQKITPFLWFDNQTEEAVNFYIAVFNRSKIKTTTRYEEESAKASGMPKNSVMTMAFQIEDQDFVAINGGPAFKINPSVSFFVYATTEAEVEELWNKLSAGGKILMELDKYPFSEKYGWVEDKFGVSWQIMISTGEIEQKIIPSLMFTKNSGKTEEAVNFYTSVFKSAKPGSFFRYEHGQAPDEDSKVAYADFTLEGQKFAAMDGGHMHDFSFNEAISFVVNCVDQKEIDFYWDRLTEGGFEGAQQCGWLQDKFGVSWQIVPNVLGELLSDPAKSGSVMRAMLQMKKLDIKMLQDAVNQ